MVYFRSVTAILFDSYRIDYYNIAVRFEINITISPEDLASIRLNRIPGKIKREAPKVLTALGRSNSEILQFCHNSLADILNSTNIVKRKQDMVKMMKAMEEKGEERTFRPGLEMVLASMPEPSFQRDVVLDDLLNRTYTTWADMDQARGLFLIPSDESQPEKIFDRIPGWYVHRQVNQATTPEQKMMMVETFFGGMGLLEKVGQEVKGGNIEKEAENRELFEVLRSFKKDGLSFLQSSTEKERLYFLSLFLSGKNGLFSEESFPTHGKKLINTVIDKAMTVQLFDTHHKGIYYQEREREMTKEAAGLIFAGMTPERRTQVFSKFISGFIDAGDNLSKDYMIKVFLDSFGAVGGKLGQVDDVIPENVRTLINYYKEHMPPGSKLLIAEKMKREGRDKVYEGIGKVMGGGTMAVVRSAKIRGDETEKACIKNIRQEAIDQVEGDLTAGRPGLVYLVKELGINLDIGAFYPDFSRMVIEETDVMRESENTRIIDEFRKKSGGSIKTPRIIYASETGRFIEMSRIEGISLEEIFEHKEKIHGNKYIHSNEDPYRDIDLTEVYEKVLKDGFWQVFRLGRFHTDLHPGNIRTEPASTVSEIDYGQSAQEDDQQKREAMLTYSLGLYCDDTRLVSRGLSWYSGISYEEIKKYFREHKGQIPKVTTQFLSDYKVGGSFNRFLKAFTALTKYIEEVGPMTRLTLPIPHVARSKRLRKEIFKHPKLITAAVKDFRGKKELPSIETVLVELH